VNNSRELGNAHSVLVVKEVRRKMEGKDSKSKHLRGRRSREEGDKERVLRE
jgi:hypothetical protein